MSTPCKVVGLAIALAGAAAAPGPSQAEELQQGRWVVDLGLALRARPTHLTSSDYTTDIVPIIDATWGKRVHISLEDGARWTAVRAGRLSLGPVAEYRQSYNDRLPPRSRRLSDAVELGGFGQINLTYAVLDGRLRKAVNGYEGLSADLSLGTEFPVARGLTFGIEARSSWADRRFAAAVAAPAASGSAPYRRPDYVTAGAQTGLAWRLRPAWTASFAISEDRILSSLRGRTGRSARDVVTTGLALTHRFAWGGPK